MLRFPAWVYVLRNDVNGRAYVGISCNPKKRKGDHLSNLRCGRHPVEDMQADFNLYGERVFSFAILERVEVREHRHAEYRWQLKLHTLNRRTGYNYKDKSARWHNKGP